MVAGLLFSSPIGIIGFVCCLVFCGLVFCSCCFGEVGWWFGSVDCGPVCFASVVAESSYCVNVCGGNVEWEGFVFDE